MAVGGEVAVFSTGRGTTERYEFLCRMVNDPYDFLGCWCSDDYVITGTMTADNENNFVSAVWLCKTESDEVQAAAEQQGLLPMAGLAGAGNTPAWRGNGRARNPSKRPTTASPRAIKLLSAVSFWSSDASTCWRTCMRLHHSCLG